MAGNPRDIAHDHWNLLWGVQRSIRYHARREAFFTRWNRVTLLAAVLGGSSVFAAMGTRVPWWLALAGATLVVVLTGIDLVVGTNTMTGRHQDLRRRFADLEAELRAQPVDTVTAAQLDAWTARRIRIEADEPPAFVALDLLCENELARSYKHLADKPRVRVPRWHALTAQWCRWQND